VGVEQLQRHGRKGADSGVAQHRRTIGTVRQAACWGETEVLTIYRRGDGGREHLERSQRADLCGDEDFVDEMQAS
jgi:hypothetical protein